MMKSPAGLSHTRSNHRLDRPGLARANRVKLDVGCMDLNEVHRRWGRTAAKWVWTTGPFYAFEPDGAERRSLEPVDEVDEHAYDDEDAGFWTCDKNTKMHDLAVIYRSGARNDDGRLPRHGPKDICYVMLATS